MQLRYPGISFVRGCQLTSSKCRLCSQHSMSGVLSAVVIRLNNLLFTARCFYSFLLSHSISNIIFTKYFLFLRFYNIFAMLYSILLSCIVMYYSIQVDKLMYNQSPLEIIFNTSQQTWAMLTKYDKIKETFIVSMRIIFHQNFQSKVHGNLSLT